MKNLMRSMTEVYESVTKSGKLEIDASPAVEHIKSALGIDDAITAIIFCYFFCAKINGGYNFFSISDDMNLDYSISEALTYVDKFEYLLKRGLFMSRNHSPYKDETFDDYYQMTISDELENMIIHNKDLSKYAPRYLNSEYNFSNYILGLMSEGVKTAKIHSATQSYTRPFLSDPDVRNMLLDFGMTELQLESGELPYGEEYSNLRYFLSLVKYATNNPSPRNIKSALMEYSFYAAEVVEFLTSIKNGNNILFNKGYLTTKGGEVLDNLDYDIGEKVMTKLGDKAFIIGSDELKGMEKISSDKIKKKELFYNPKNQKDIQRLKSILEEDNYQGLRKRLEEKGFGKGLTIILFGPPGTGKTETVMQLAKETGRDVLHLNIEEVRSCWVGESEKNIKAVFKTYAKLKSDKKPILLFNEADAILSKRTSVDGANASVTKMENTIQNILLEELENFDGIFIATSNLVDNFDKAFERRFLYKLELQNPDFEAKKKIIKSKLPELEDDVISEISKNYDLSGGQIDNISKKIEVDYILYGNKPTRESVIDFCNKEKFDDGEKHMGF